MSFLLTHTRTHRTRCAALMCCFDVTSIVLISPMGGGWNCCLLSNREAATRGRLSAVQVKLQVEPSFPSTHWFTQELLSVHVCRLREGEKIPPERAELESHPISYYLHKYTSLLCNSNDSRYSRINEITLKWEHSELEYPELESSALNLA